MSEAPHHASAGVEPAHHHQAVTPTPPAADVPTLEAPQAYRPLSLLSVLAVVLGAFYSVVVLVGGLLPFARVYPRSFVVALLLGPTLGGLAAVLARVKSGERIATFAAIGLGVVVVLIGMGGLVMFSGSQPWEPGVWTWFVLVAGLLVSFISLAQIKSAEGALAGRELARAGLYLCLFFGGFYLLYVAGNQFAVTNQAHAEAERFVQMLTSDDLPQAYRETIKPGSRPAGSNLLEEIERGFNAPRGREQGEYSGFCTSPVVQSFRMGGVTKYSHTSTAAEFTTLGYKADVRYQVKNDMGEFVLVVAVLSIEVGGRREWYVAFPGCRIEKAVETPFVRDVARSAGETLPVTDSFLRAITFRQDKSAYLMTLPPEKRNDLGRVLVLSQPEFAALAGPLPAVVYEGMAKERAELEAGTKEFLKVAFLDDKDFVTDARTKQRQTQAVREWISHTGRTVASAEVMQTSFPTVKRVGDEMEVARPVRFIIEPQDDLPQRLYVEGELICRGTLGREAVQDRYRVVGLRLVRSAIAPAAPTPMGKGPP